MKKNWKKLTCLLVALTLMLASAGSVYAETLGNQSGQSMEQSVVVKGKYTLEGTQEKIISVDIAWDPMEFEYKEVADLNWSTENHTYSNPQADDWMPTTNTIRLGNHSNIPIGVTFAYTPKDGFSDVSAKFTLKKNNESVGTEGSMCILDEGKNVENSIITDQVDALVGLSGKMPSSYTSMTDIGSITITIAEATATNS
ncbi:MAG: hypothetical protein E7428_11040 [Ruminococcaceae bacterium]|nr:hypothetical protein [Oscillospiraceae bacterium]